MRIDEVTRGNINRLPDPIKRTSRDALYTQVSATLTKYHWSVLIGSVQGLRDSTENEETAQILSEVLDALNEQTGIS